MKSDPLRYLLPEHVHLCVMDDGAVFLDLKRDKYFGLGTAQCGPLRSLMESGDVRDESARELVASLVEAQLLTRAEGRSVTAPLLDVDAADSALINMDFYDAPDTRFAHAASFVAACGAAVLSLQWRSLEYSVRRVRQRKERCARGGAAFDFDVARPLVAAFYRLRPLFYSARDHCLFDSLALLEFLARYYLFPAWVLGVRTGPFMAHSWVQEERVVLNDIPERTRGYVPILVV